MSSHGGGAGASTHVSRLKHDMIVENIPFEARVVVAHKSAQLL